MNKIIINLLFLLLVSFEIFSQNCNDIFPPDPIYGEENAPDTIYYKYVSNHSSNTFFYAMIKDSETMGKDIIFLIIISLETNDGIILYHYNNYIEQYSIEYDPFFYLDPKMKYPLYWLKYDPGSYHYDDAKYYLLGQFEYDFKLIHKNDVEQLLDDTFSKTCRVYIDYFLRDSPYYIRNNE